MTNQYQQSAVRNSSFIGSPKTIGIVLACLLLVAQTSFAQSNEPEKVRPRDALKDYVQPLCEPYMMKGEFSEGEQALQDHLKLNPKDDQARFGLGVIQFLQGVEHLGTSLSRFGPEKNSSLGLGIQVPFLRFPVEKGQSRQAVELKDVREMFQQIIVHLEKADQTLEGITSDDVRLPLLIYQINFDFNEDGVLGANEENFDRIAARYFGRPRLPKGVKELRDLVVVFDRADVYWLQAYSHLLRGLCEAVLAYDQSELWNVSAHYLFENANVKYDFLVEEKSEWDEISRHWMSFTPIADVIASIHNLRFKLIEPERVKRVETHVHGMIKYSRKMWDSILAETDNEREWLPSPQQNAATTNARITQRRVDTWLTFLDETEKILNGEMLIPFWRGTDKTRGVNLKKFFDDPEDVDVVLWVHGSGAVNYLEKGNVTSPATWRTFQDVFGGDFFGFAAWIN